VTDPRTPNPSPLAGEAGEGLGGEVLLGGREPSPDRSLRSQSSSPGTGEGKAVIGDRVGKEGKLGGRGPSPDRSLRSQSASPGTGEGRTGIGDRVGKEAKLSGRRPSPDRSLRSRSASPGTGEGMWARPLEKPLVGRLQRRRARELRSRMTDAERKLWFALRDRRFAGFKFRRQVPIGPFIADFVCFEARLVIEVDGGQHADSAQDRRRDRWLAANKFRVMRFWNNEVRPNLEGVMTLLAGALRVEEWA
jgi:very-short-patch-repair endonuclease